MDAYGQIFDVDVLFLVPNHQSPGGDGLYIPLMIDPARHAGPLAVQ